MIFQKPSLFGMSLVGVTQHSGGRCMMTMDIFCSTTKIRSIWSKIRCIAEENAEFTLQKYVVELMKLSVLYHELKTRSNSIIFHGQASDQTNFIQSSIKRFFEFFSFFLQRTRYTTKRSQFTSCWCGSLPQQGNGSLEMSITHRSFAQWPGNVLPNHW